MRRRLRAVPTPHPPAAPVPPGPTKEFLSLDEVGALLGVKRGRAWELARAGYLPSVRLGRRWYVPRKALDRLADDAFASTRTALARLCGKEDAVVRPRY